MKRVFVTGMGVISAIGNNTNENLTHLRSGKTGIGKAVFLDSIYRKDHDFSEVKTSTDSLYKQFGLNESGLTRTDLLAYSAFQEAVDHAHLFPKKNSSKKTAFISASTIGGMCLINQIYEDANLMTSGSEYSDRVQEFIL